MIAPVFSPPQLAVPLSTNHALPRQYVHLPVPAIPSARDSFNDDPWCISHRIEKTGPSLVIVVTLHLTSFFMDIPSVE